MIEYNMEVDEPFFDPDDRPRKHMTREEYKTVRHRSSCRHIFEKNPAAAGHDADTERTYGSGQKSPNGYPVFKTPVSGRKQQNWLDMLEQFLSENGLS